MLPTYDLPKVVERNYPSFNGRARMNWCDGVWKSWNDSEKFEIGVFFDKSTNFEATFEKQRAQSKWRQDYSEDNSGFKGFKAVVTVKDIVWE